MRLLVLTQKADPGDDILGFFYGWILKFAENFPAVTVVCLESARAFFKLPENIEILSLGKEEGLSHLGYVFRFYKYIWKERKNYDAVFVHMNEEYVLLGAFLWRLMGKKIFLWRNHAKGNIFTDLAVWMSDRVFCTSEFSYTARFKKTILMPAGIDTEVFNPNLGAERDEKRILYIGRISPVKKIEMILAALLKLDEKGVDFKAHFYGNPGWSDKTYSDKMRTIGGDMEKKGKISWNRALPNPDMPTVYGSSWLSVNATPEGSFDKTIFEAMACGEMVYVSNKSLVGKIPAEFIFKNENDLALKLGKALSFSREEKEKRGKELREFVVKEHSLDVLVRKLKKIISGI